MCNSHSCLAGPPAFKQYGHTTGLSSRFPLCVRLVELPPARFVSAMGNHDVYPLGFAYQLTRNPLVVGLNPTGPTRSGHVLILRTCRKPDKSP